MKSAREANVLAVIQLIKQHPNLFKDKAILSIDNVFEKLKIIVQKTNLSLADLGNFTKSTRYRFSRFIY